MCAIDLVLMARPVRRKPKDSSLKAACHLHYLSLSTSAAENHPVRCSWHYVTLRLGPTGTTAALRRQREASRFPERTKKEC